jgi:deoxyguanosine kinase
MSPHPYIAIEGAIGVGKTSLARILGEALSAEILLEVFEENPFLSDFYLDRERYAFQTQVFFLLSRYRQQHRVIAQTLKTAPLVSDYLFAKDWLFAHLNLAGDELDMYERVHAILGEHIPSPNLVVFLKAPTTTLMSRIALRDRIYERQMSFDYIESLRMAYERFFDDYRAGEVLTVDTEDFDFVHDPTVRSEIVARIKNAIRISVHQLPLPDVLRAPTDASTESRIGWRWPEVQEIERQHDLGSESDLFLDFLALAEGLGGLGRTLRGVWSRQDQLFSQVGNRQEAREKAVEASGPELEEQLIDVFALVRRIASGAGIDLEHAYMSKLLHDSRAAGDTTC